MAQLLEVGPSGYRTACTPAGSGSEALYGGLCCAIEGSWHCVFGSTARVQVNGQDDCDVLLYWRRSAKYGDVEAMLKLGFALYEGTCGECPAHAAVHQACQDLSPTWERGGGVGGSRGGLAPAARFEK